MNDIKFFIDSRNIRGYSEYAITKTIQGIVNRTSPRLYILGDSFAYSNTDREWMEYYKSSKNCCFEELLSVKEIILKFIDSFSGIITFNHKIRGHSEWSVPLADTAAVIAGITGVLPVLAKDAESISKETGLKILDSVMLTNSNESKTITARLETLNLNTYTEVYEWQVDNLLPFVNQNEYMLMTWEGLDLAVQRKMLFLDLHICTNKQDKSLEEKVNRYFGDNNDVFYVWGWVEDEYVGIHSLSTAGGVLKCIASNNLSFHAVVPSQIREFKQKTNIEEFTVEPNKFYITFYASEADTVKAPLSFNHGGYLSPERGKIAINWGMPANTIEDFPSIAEYYQNTATENDYFYTTGGTYEGYADYPVLPEKSKQKLIENSKVLSKKSDQPYLDYFAFCFHDINKQAYSEFAKRAGIMGLSGRSNNAYTEIERWDGVLAVDRYYSYINHSPALCDRRIFKGDFVEKDGKLYGTMPENFFMCYVAYDCLTIHLTVDYNYDTSGVVSIRGFINTEMDTYYEARISEGKRIELARVIKGDEVILSSYPANISPNTSYSVRMYLDGETIKVAFGENSRLNYIMNIYDNSITKGTYGLYSTNTTAAFSKFTCTPYKGWQEVYNNILRETVNTDKNGGICAGFYGVIVNEDVTTSQFHVENSCGQWILMSPTDLKRVMDKLEQKYPGKFEAVTLDKFMLAARYFESLNSTNTTRKE
ncbi:MAG TPA: hypothetical protein GXX54_02560 [Clostridiales bacterium]|nr:hypothetical protein [Clostridiales bacterium]